MWVESKKYKALGSVLTLARRQSGLTQVQLAKRLRKPQSFVSSYETGQRRIDVLEFIQITGALKVDAGRLLRKIERQT